MYRLLRVNSKIQEETGIMHMQVYAGSETKSDSLNENTSVDSYLPLNMEFLSSMEVTCRQG